MDWITIIGLFAGGGAMGFISSLLTFKAFYRQKTAESNKATQEAEQEKIKTVDTLDSLMDKFALRMEKQVVDYEKTIKIQDEKIVLQDKKIVVLEKNHNENKRVIDSNQKTIKAVNITLEETKKVLQLYINQCQTCENNKITKS